VRQHSGRQERAKSAQYGLQVRPLLRPGQFAYLGESDAAARIPCSVTVMPLGVSLTSDSWRSFLMHSGRIVSGHSPLISILSAASCGHVSRSPLIVRSPP
jgi:hypothetical protein